MFNALTRPNCIIADDLLHVLFPSFHQSPAHATFPVFQWLVIQYCAGIQPAHHSALQNRAWAWMGSCCFLCLPPTPPGSGNWFEHLPELPTPQDRMCTPGLVNSIFPGPPWTKAPTSPPRHCLEQNWQGKHLSSHCLHETENGGRPRARVYAETRGAGQLRLCSDPIIHSSHSSFSPTRCSNPTHLSLHFWLE